MAAKEATVYIVDIGATMREHGQGRSENNLEFAMKYVWDKLTTTIASGRKTLLVGAIALRSRESENAMLEEDPDHYSHIVVLHELQQLQMTGLRELRAGFVACSETKGDTISALIVAIDMIMKTCKKLAYLKNIILVTDARGVMAVDGLPDISEQLLQESINLTVLGVDFDDSEYGFKEENKDITKYENEKILRQLCEDVKGAFGTVAQAVEELEIPRIKQVKPIPSYKGFLTIGDPDKYEEALSINVERYPKTMVAAPPSASSHVLRSSLEATLSQAKAEDDQSGGDELSGVKNARTYQVLDPKAPGGKQEVDFENLAKGYEYGRTAVHISESDQNVTAFETPRGMSIIGMVEEDKYERYFEMSKTHMIISEKGNDRASMALSSLIHALYESKLYAVARLVPKENKQPLVVLLTPNIEPDFECLYEVELPFTEDLRSYKFPPLDRVLTVSGKSITVHRTLPSNDLQKAMSDYVDSMDLSTFAQDDEGNPAEYAPPDETFSPVLHHLNFAIRQRAVHPGVPIPPPLHVLTQYSNPPAQLVDRSKKILEKLIQVGDVKKVPPKARGKKYGKKEEKPLSELDIGALLASDPKRMQKRIDSSNAVPEFKQLLETSSSLDDLRDAVKQLSTIIMSWIEHSVGDVNYDKAIEAIGVMRGEMIELEDYELYNDFLATFKTKLMSEKLGGDRRGMWYLVKRNKMGPISQRVLSVSNMTEEEATTFMSNK